VENSADKGWIVDGKLYIDPKREAFLDYSKELTDKGYSNGTQDWTEGWYADMAGTGPQPVFGYFGPSWLINYVMAGNSGGSAPGEGTYGDWAVCQPPVGFFWGGTWLIANKELENDPAKKAAVTELIDWITLDCTEEGMQYAWANGILYNTGYKDTVVSGTVMAMSDGTLPFLGGQNMYDAFIPAARLANGKCISEYDSTISIIWRDQVRQYAAGNKTRSQAIADFKQAVKDQLGIDPL
jgi:multiple sugar transport system substrate-binding protein